MRSRIPRPLARRIDRLARIAHNFHRFAHHPLCREYADEVVRLGRRARVCRGCLLTGSGLGAGGLAGLFAGAPVIAGMVALALSAVMLVPTLVVARAGIARPPKIFSRFLPIACLGFAGGVGLRAISLAGIALAASAGLLVLLLTWLYKRRGPDRTPCRTCPERTLAGACRGFQPILRRERAFQRLVGRWLAP